MSCISFILKVKSALWLQNNLTWYKVREKCLFGSTQAAERRGGPNSGWRRVGPETAHHRWTSIVALAWYVTAVQLLLPTRQ